MASVRKKNSQIEKFGAAKAPWVVYWRDVNENQKSKSFPAGERGKREAKAFADKVDAEQKLGIQSIESDVSWARFRREYEEFKQPKVRGITLKNTRTSLDHFERLIGPRKVSRISQRDIDRFTSLRQKEQGQYGPVAVVSVVTTLKNIQTALRQAKRWKYLDEVSEFQMPRVEQRQPSYISQDEFAAMYEAAAEMTSPQIPGVTPADYWRALITFLYLTGWRIGSSVALRWDQIEETDQGVVVYSPAEQNKGKRDVQILLHPEVARHLTPLREAESATVFPRREISVLRRHFARLQQLAAITPRFKHEGQWYGFHDFRRGFATNNVANLNTMELMQAMQHRSLATTQRYIRMAEESTAQNIASKIVVPDFLTTG